MAVLLSNDRGEKREEVVSFVPVSSDALDNQPSTVEIIPMPETGSLIGYGDLPQDAPCDCKCTVTYDAQPSITNVTIQTSKGLEDIEPGGWDKPQLTKEQRDRLTKSAGEISGWIRVTYQLAGASITTAGKGKGIVVARHTSVGIATAQSAWQILYRRGDLLGYTSSGPDEVQKMRVNCPGEARFDSKSYEVFIALIDSPNNIELRIGDEITATGGCTGCAGGSGETKWTVPLEWEKGKLKGVGKVEEIKPKEK